MTVAILFARRDSIYKTLPDVDVYDIDRDALNWAGGTPAVAHPPCRLWGRMRQFSISNHRERDLAVWAVKRIRIYGGVLEHPAESRLWIEMLMPRPGMSPDVARGYSIEVEQFHWGHRAEKRTWLYIVGCEPDDLPPIPRREGNPTHCIRPTKSHPRLPSVTKPEREQTPKAFALWLVEVARRCRKPMLMAA